MQNVWVLASLWVGLALIATLLAIWFKITTALTEIVVGTVAQLVVGAFLVQGGPGAKSEWITFLAGTGAIVLTSLAGAEPRSVDLNKWQNCSPCSFLCFPMNQVALSLPPLLRRIGPQRAAARRAFLRNSNLFHMVLILI